MEIHVIPVLDALIFNSLSNLLHVSTVHSYSILRISGFFSFTMLSYMYGWAGFLWRVLASNHSFLISSTSIHNRKKLKISITEVYFSQADVQNATYFLSSTHMANFNILILPSNQNSENILFLVYRWCCNRKREQLPVGGELLQATCSLKYQLLE